MNEKLIQEVEFNEKHNQNFMLDLSALVLAYKLGVNFNTAQKHIMNSENSKQYNPELFKA